MSKKQQLARFLSEVRDEMKIVSSPALKEVRHTTVVVVVFVFLFAAYLYGIDLVLTPFDRWLFTPK